MCALVSLKDGSALPLWDKGLAIAYFSGVLQMVVVYDVDLLRNELFSSLFDCSGIPCLGERVQGSVKREGN